MKTVAVIGSGFSGLSAAACLAGQGFQVSVFEKNETAGGRAREFREDGFRFDMGPSWYWMPDVYEDFFKRFGKKTSDFYSLQRLDPSYRIFFQQNKIMDVPAGENALADLFDRIEPGSGKLLKEFLAEGKFKYDTGMKDMVYKPGLSFLELLDWRIIKSIFKLDIFRSVASSVRKKFRDGQLIQLLEFPCLFLGAPASRTPALYTLMNYADMALGTWYPKGGMYRIVDAMVALAKELGVQFEFNSPVTELIVNDSRISEILVGGERRNFDFVVASADYHHVEQTLLPKQFRKYSEKYWEKRTLAPSCLIFYLGINKKLNGLNHHTLFFDEEFDRHSKDIYDHPVWPENPLFYMSCTTQTDPDDAPEGHEALFILIPVAPGLHDTEEIRSKYFDHVIARIERLTHHQLRDNIVFKKSFAHRDFIDDYNAFKGNAYGLANTILQTANLKPSIENKKVRNLFYTGQLTVPGPGMPPAIISGQVVADELIKRIKTDRLH